MKAAVVLAALLLSAGMVSSVVFYERAEDARLKRRERQQDCQAQTQALDRCLAARRGTAAAVELDRRISKDCHEFWDPVIGEACK